MADAIAHPLTLTSKPTGEHFEFVRSARGAGAGLFEFVWTLAPGKRGPGPHVHEHETETFTGVSGVLRIWIDDVPHDLEPGMTIAVPPNTPHRFLNPGPEPAVARVTLDGTRMEDLFVPMAVAVQRGMSMARVIAKMTVQVVKDPPSTPTSRVGRGVFRALAATLRVFGARPFAPVHGWEPRAAADEISAAGA